MPILWFDLSLFHHPMEDHRDMYISVREDPEEITRLLINIHSESSIFYVAQIFLQLLSFAYM